MLLLGFFLTVQIWMGSMSEINSIVSRKKLNEDRDDFFGGTYDHFITF
jgi:hypothetical protein